MKNQKTIVIGLSVLVIFMLFGAGTFAAGVLLGRYSNRIPAIAKSPTPPAAGGGTAGQSQSQELNAQFMDEVLGILRKEFYGDIPDDQTLTYGAIEGMLTKLDDPYTSFIEPDYAAILNEDSSGEFEGIGAMVTMTEDGYLQIESLLPGQPAEKAGLKPGDIILAVGDQSLVGLGLYEAISYVRGPAGTDAVLKIAREDESEPLIITVTRAKIDVPMVQYKMLDDGIAYIKLTEFDQHASDKVDDALRELLKQHPKGLIFDLRNNPGGWLSEAQKVADIFLDKGLVAIKRDKEGHEDRLYTYNGDIGEDIPMVVLVNQYSASASEIVAGALQDRNRAILIGEKTLGKGSVQIPHNLPDGSQLRVTVAHWFTPNDKCIHGEGITPDIEAPFPTDTPTGEDPQLDRAEQYLLQGK